MTAPLLQNNQELFNYLTVLSDHLRSRGQTELANVVRTASQFAFGSQSEFLSEAQDALKKVRSSNSNVLDQEQSSKITDIINQIQVAFIKVGGA
jgi:hypothetical protein